MKKSDNINELAAALSKTQAALTRARESATNPFLKNSYADLGDVWDAAREPMTTHGLSIAQFPTSEGDNIGLVTVLLHESGQWLQDTVYLPLSDERGKSQAQVAGSIISYLRRYGLSAVLGVVTGEDDDGTAGSDPRATTTRGNSNGNGKKIIPVENEIENRVINSAEPKVFFEAVVDLCPRYDHINAAKATLKKLGYTALSKTAEGRVNQLRHVQRYAANRDAGMDEDNAMAAAIPSATETEAA